jgi:hypothetical protein
MPIQEDDATGKLVSSEDIDNAIHVCRSATVLLDIKASARTRDEPA